MDHIIELVYHNHLSLLSYSVLVFICRMTGDWRTLFIISISGLLLPSHGVNRNGITYPFPITSLLTCRVPDPKRGLKASMPEPRFRVPLVPGLTGTVWRPAESQYDLAT